MTASDKDGNEVKPVGELEYLFKMGGEFDRTIVILHVDSKNLDKQEVSNLLEIAPTRAWNPHEPHPVGKRGNIRVVDWGNWKLEESNSSSVEAKIETLFDRCSSNLENWQILTSKYDVCLSIVGYLYNWNRELDLSPKILKLISDRNIRLKVDVYFQKDI
jgi:hypothetical protein